MTTPLTPVLTTSSVMITWSIQDLGTKNLPGLTDAVVEVLWKLTGEQAVEGSTSTLIVTRTGAISIEPDPAEFIPFDQLTPAQVINWVNVKLGYDQTQQLIKNIVKEIDLQKNPVQYRTVPW